MPAMYSPDRLIFSESTPYLMKVRADLRISSGPLHTLPKLNSSNFMCGSVLSPSAPMVVISWLPAR